MTPIALDCPAGPHRLRCSGPRRDPLQTARHPAGRLALGLLVAAGLVGCDWAATGATWAGGNAPAGAAAPGPAPQPLPELVPGIAPRPAARATTPDAAIDPGIPSCERFIDRPTQDFDPPALMPAPLWLDDGSDTRLRVEHRHDRRFEGRFDARPMERAASVRSV